jgi:nicotinamide-nucleotide amidase
LFEAEGRTMEDERVSRPRYEVEVISTGDEIVFGQLVDTNSSWIAKEATKQGARVRRLSCVGDDIEDIVKAVDRGVSEGRDLIVITGGLGPSPDDVTVEALARATGKRVIYDERAVKMLESNCRAASIAVTEPRKRMARSVEGADPIENAVGLAPGLRMQVGRTLIIALPGIPKEMKPMFKRFVEPLIARHTVKRSVARKLHILMPYYHTFSILQTLRVCFPDVYIKTHSKPPTHGKDPDRVYGMNVDVVVWGEKEGDCEDRLQEVQAKLVDLVAEQGGQVRIDT